ncbi:MAG: DUF4840 domain-containing protein [Prevotella sp.]|uniref:DUF4840 domain-containing protein n=1 Tax=Segatella cerevisiae TaxID=2053716 RepID=A0ABT1BUR5_9BACT|nr:DUF4840 domain-containing protein [Segatella cerevisiae]MCI1245905.1 DUF4840 domain-containing protein [Prevotella sp.]MCO6024825.1 DUF4840 domain-containing protein [Segatella cerevisiae]
MKKLKATLFLICGLGTAMFLSSCLGDNDNSSNTINLSQGQRTELYYHIAKEYSGKLIRLYQANEMDPTDPTSRNDTLASINWVVKENEKDTTINIDFPIAKLAKYISDSGDKQIVASTPSLPLVVQYRAPYIINEDYYNKGYYVFGSFIKDKKVDTKNGNTDIEINFSVMDQTGTDEEGETIYFFSSNNPVIWFNEQYAQVIDIESIKVGDKIYPLRDDVTNDNAAHFEIIYSTGDNN